MIPPTNEGRNRVGSRASRWIIGRLHRGKGIFRSQSTSQRHALVGPSYLWKEKRNFQFQFLKSQGLTPEKRLLDIGCGTLRGGIPLIDYLNRGNYAGIEVRADVLEEGRRELREAGLVEKKPMLIHSQDLSEITLDPFDVIWAFSVMIHMTDDIATSCVELAGRHLMPTGAFFANVNLGERMDERWQGFPVRWRPLSFYEELATEHGLKVTTMGMLKELGHKMGAGDEQQMLRFEPSGEKTPPIRRVNQLP